MAINRIKVENFTVFDKIEIDFSEGINVFVGENGTGKTHLLKIIYSICAWKPDPLIDMDPSIAQKLQRCFQYLPFKDLANRGIGSENADNAITIMSWISGENKTYKIWNYSVNGEYECEANGLQESFPVLFIPPKEMLTHGGLEKDYIDRHLPFDVTLIDILNKTGVSTVKNITKDMLSILERLSRIINGKIVYKNDRYYTERPDGTLIDFAAEAEGYKKFGLLYRLIETGHLQKGSVLIWDEPESNLNPTLVPFLVDILFELEYAGIQMFLATHDYFLVKYLEVRKQKHNKITYHAMHKAGMQVLHESSLKYELLENNSLINQSIELYKEEVSKVME